MAAAFPGCQHQGIVLIFSSFKITMPTFVKCYTGLVEGSSDTPFPFTVHWGVAREHVSSLGVGVGSVDRNQLTVQLFFIRKSTMLELWGSEGFLPQTSDGVNTVRWLTKLTKHWE